MTTFVHCRGCGAQIHETAIACPKCGAPQQASAHQSASTASKASASSSSPPNAYAAVPLLRRRWLVLLLLITLTPIASIVAMTGEVFYKGAGRVVKSFPKNIKLSLMLATLPWLVYIFGNGSSSMLAAVGLIALALILALKK